MDRDVVLADPLLWDERENDWFAQGEKYIFVPGSNILSLSLSSAGTESAKVGYLSDLQTQLDEERFDG